MLSELSEEVVVLRRYQGGIVKPRVVMSRRYSHILSFSRW